LAELPNWVANNTVNKHRSANRTAALLAVLKSQPRLVSALSVHRKPSLLRQLAVPLLGLFLLPSSSERADSLGKNLARFERSEPHMGTLVRIVVYASSQEAASSRIRQAFDRVREIDQSLSDYRADSELSRLSQQAGGPPAKVGPDLFQVLSASQNLAMRSQGAFDVTAGPLTLLWRRARRQSALPESDRVAAALAVSGFRLLALDAGRQTARLAKTGMRLDLGGIAKGYSADEALKTLRRAGLDRALVAVGGDVAVSNPPPGKKGWTIDIAPLDASVAKQPPLSLQNAAVSTSGDAEQFFELGGVRYSHIIDPRTGQALTGWRSVTVVATRGIDSDSLATAVSVMPPTKGLQLIDATPSAQALMVIRNDQGIRAWKSRRWRK